MRRFPVRFSVLLWLSAAAGLCACGTSHDNVAKQLGALQSDIARLQSHSDRLEARLEALELRKDDGTARASAAANATSSEASSAVVERPRLMVVKLEPGDDGREPVSDAPTAELRLEDSAADQSPRPLIRVHGTRTDDASDGAESARRKRSVQP